MMMRPPVFMYFNAANAAKFFHRFRVLDLSLTTM